MRTMTVIARRFALAATLAAAFAADTTDAFATDYCVTAPSCVGTNEPNLQAALTAAQAAGANEITLGPGTYVGSFDTSANAIGFKYVPAAGATVKIRGAGAAKTILSPPSGSHTTSKTLDMNASGGIGNAILDLTVLRGNTTMAATAIDANTGPNDIERVAIGDVDPANPEVGQGINVDGDSANIADCTITMGVAGTVPIFAAGTGSSVDVNRCTLTGFYGAYSNPGSKLDVTRTAVTLIGSGGGGAVYGYGQMTAHDVLARMTAPGEVGLAALANPTSSGSLIAKNITVVGGSGDVGVIASSTVADVGHNAHLTLDSSIVRGTVTSLQTIQGGGGASISVLYSDYATAGVSGSNITAGAGNVDNVDPQFVDPATFNFHLGATSPLLDSGNPSALVLGESSFDLAAVARVAHGRMDMGAYEYQRKGPSAAVVVTPNQAIAGQPVVFDGAGSSDPDPGDALSYSWTFDDGSIAAGATVAHAFAVPGPHAGTLTVTDPLGLSASTPGFVLVSPAPPPGSNPGPTGPTPGPGSTAKFAGVSFTKTKLTLSSTKHVSVSLKCPKSTTGSCAGILTLKAKLSVSTKSKSKATTHTTKSGPGRSPLATRRSRSRPARRRPSR